MSNFSNIAAITAVLDDAQQKLTNLTGRKVTISIDKTKPTIAHWRILLVMCEGGNVSVEEILSMDQSRELTNVRFLIAHYINTVLGDDEVLISNLLKRDRSTINYALKQAKIRIETHDPATMRIMEYAELTIPQLSIFKTNDNA